MQIQQYAIYSRFPFETDIFIPTFIHLFNCKVFQDGKPITVRKQNGGVNHCAASLAVELLRLFNNLLSTVTHTVLYFELS